MQSKQEVFDDHTKFYCRFVWKGLWVAHIWCLEKFSSHPDKDTGDERCSLYAFNTEGQMVRLKSAHQSKQVCVVSKCLSVASVLSSMYMWSASQNKPRKRFGCGIKAEVFNSYKVMCNWNSSNDCIQILCVDRTAVFSGHKFVCGWNSVMFTDTNCVCKQSHGFGRTGFVWKLITSIGWIETLFLV